MTSPTEGGSGGASPPAFTRTTGTSKSPSEAVFIYGLILAYLDTNCGWRLERGISGKPEFIFHSLCLLANSHHGMERRWYWYGLDNDNSIGVVVVDGNVSLLGRRWFYKEDYYRV